MFEKSLSYPKKYNVGYCKIIDGKIGVTYGSAGDELALMAYTLNDPDKKIKKIISFKIPEDQEGELNLKYNIIFDLLNNDEIVFGLSHEIKVTKYSLSNDSRKTIINYNYTGKKYPEDVIEKIRAYYKKYLPNKEPKIPEYYRMLSEIVVDDKNDIWIFIYSNEKTGFMKFNKDGKFLEDYDLVLQNKKLEGTGKIIIKKNNIYFFGKSDEGAVICRGTLN